MQKPYKMRFAVRGTAWFMWGFLFVMIFGYIFLLYNFANGSSYNNLTKWIIIILTPFLIFHELINKNKDTRYSCFIFDDYSVRQRNFYREIIKEMPWNEVIEAGIINIKREAYEPQYGMFAFSYKKHIIYLSKKALDEEIRPKVHFYAMENDDFFIIRCSPEALRIVESHFKGDIINRDKLRGEPVVN
ncbi:MAG: hypothetical protein GYA50_02160 [Eubacteriaceae bacterium]|nr:hypothetical protein [Eubacteriaceae bacterium]